MKGIYFIPTSKNPRSSSLFDSSIDPTSKFSNQCLSNKVDARMREDKQSQNYEDIIRNDDPSRNVDDEFRVLGTC